MGDSKTASVATVDSPKPSQAAEQRRRRILHHRNVLFACSVVVLLALSLKTRTDQRIELAWLPGIPMPETCASRSMFDVECPGCGLTRSFIAMAAGDFSNAFQMNRTGWMLACAMLIQFPYRLFLLHHLKTHGLTEPVPEWLKTTFLWTLIVALIGNWLLKILGI